MVAHRFVTEMGMGTDVHGGDYTKAARRAVSDAIRHSSLHFFKPLGLTAQDMQIRVKIGVAQPEAVDLKAVAAELPYGRVTVEVERGGLDAPTDSGEPIVIAVAAVMVFLEMS